MKQTEIKQTLLKALKAGMDSHLELIGYHRSPKGLVYSRRDNGAKKHFEFNFASNPSYAPGNVAHLTPSVRIENPSISDLALRLVGDPWLLANAPKAIQNQRLTLLTEPQMPEWYVSTFDGLEPVIADVRNVFEEHGVPFLDSYSTPLGIIRQYEAEDKRALRQLHFYVYVIAAYCLVERREDALAVLEERFAKPGIRKRYSSLWTNLNAEQ